MLEIEVCEVRGICPVYEVGDRVVIDGLELFLTGQMLYVFTLYQPSYTMQWLWTKVLTRLSWGFQKIKAVPICSVCRDISFKVIFKEK